MLRGQIERYSYIDTPYNPLELEYGYPYPAGFFSFGVPVSTLTLFLLNSFLLGLQLLSCVFLLELGIKIKII